MKLNLPPPLAMMVLATGCATTTAGTPTPTVVPTATPTPHPAPTPVSGLLLAYQVGFRIPY